MLCIAQEDEYIAERLTELRARKERWRAAATAWLEGEKEAS
jgi:hypothetical protein